MSGSFCSPACRTAYGDSLRMGLSEPTTTEAGRCIVCGKSMGVTEPDDPACAICHAKGTHPVRSESGGEILLCSEHALLGIFKPHVRDENGVLIFEQRPGAVVLEGKRETVHGIRPAPANLSNIEDLRESGRPLRIPGAETEVQIDTAAPSFNATLRMELSVDSREALERARGEIAAAVDRVQHPGHWASTPPTEPGWYWSRQKGEVELVQIRGDQRADQRIYGESFHGLEVDEIEDDWDLVFWSERVQEPPA